MNKKLHASHKMTDPFSSIRTHPLGGGTPRFVSLQECEFCELEMWRAAAGDYIDPELFVGCWGDQR